MNCSFLNLFRKKTKTVRTPLVLQMETSECGVAALSIVLKFFGKDISIEQLRDDFGQSRNGTKASTIIKAPMENSFMSMTHSADILPWIVNHLKEGLVELL